MARMRWRYLTMKNRLFFVEKRGGKVLPNQHSLLITPNEKFLIGYL